MTSYPVACILPLESNRPIQCFANSEDIFVGGAYRVAENLSFQVAVYGRRMNKRIKKITFEFIFQNSDFICTILR